MTPENVTHDAWGVLILVLIGAGVGLQLLYRAFTAFLARVGDRIVKAGDDWSSRMKEIVELIHAYERDAVKRDGGMHEALRALEDRLRRDLRAMVADEHARTREAVKNLRLDVLQSKRPESIEQAISDVLSDSSPPEGLDPATIDHFKGGSRR